MSDYLLSKKIDTLILVGSTYAGNGKDESDTDYIREAAEQVSIFMINAKVSGDNIYCTYADDFQATYEVTKAFIRRGKEKILFMYDSESYSARQKMAGYEAALQDAGYPIRGNLKFKTKNDIEYTRDMLLEYNRILDFDSVLATEDGIAIGAVSMQRLRDWRFLRNWRSSDIITQFLQSAVILSLHRWTVRLGVMWQKDSGTDDRPS